MTTEQRVILRAAPKRIDALCEKVVAQLALHGILNRSRMMWNCKAGELETALQRLEGLGIISRIRLQRDYTVSDYYFLKENSDIVGALFARFQHHIQQYRQKMGKPTPEQIEQPTVETYNLDEEGEQRRGDDELAYVPLTAYMKSNATR